MNRSARRRRRRSPPRPQVRARQAATARATSATPRTRSATSACASSANSTTGSSCATPAPRSRPTSGGACRSCWIQFEAAATAAGADRALGPRRRRGLPDRLRDLRRRPAPTELVKVKSMATQEIGLNEALAADGIAAYETDLAELIVQLAGDTPSHILVPAIHYNRTEIRDIFRDRDARRARRSQRRPGRARRRPPGPTCAGGSSPPRSRSPARTSRSPTPARWSWSSPRATAGCASPCPTC